MKYSTISAHQANDLQGCQITFNDFIFINACLKIRIDQIQMISVNPFLVMRNRNRYSAKPYAVLTVDPKFKFRLNCLSD